MPMGAAVDRWRRMVDLPPGSVFETVQELWKSQLGALADVAVPMAVVGQKLVVEVTDPAAAEAVKWEAAAVMAAVNERHGAGTLDEVVCRLS
jgi:hypothetical protein